MDQWLNPFLFIVWYNTSPTLLQERFQLYMLYNKAKKKKNTP